MPPKKKLVKTFTLQLPAGQATPAPPVGPALGQHGVNIMEFCKAYNAQTESQRGDIVPAEISVYEDRTFTFILKTPPAARLLIKAAGVPKGSGVAADGQGRLGHPGPAARDRREEDGRPQRQRHRPGREDHRRHRPVDGHHRQGLTRPASRTASWEGRAMRPPETTGDTADMQRSKSYRKAAEQIDRAKLYTPAEAIKLAKETTTVKFDATVEVAMRLGVDPRKADQMVRGTVNLPHGTGKTARVIVFAAGAKADEAEAAGADEVGTDELVARIQGGWLDFDAAIATPDQMAKIGRIARILGPRGLMPNPKTGTVTMDVTKAVSDIKGGKITFRVDKHSNLHLIIGKAVVHRGRSWSTTTPPCSTRCCGPSRRRPRAST